MEETIVGLCNHRTSVNTHTTDRSSSPNRVAREEVVVFWSTEETNDAQLHDHLVDKFLCLFLSNHAVLQVTLEVDVEECTNTSQRHGSTVLVLYSTKIAEVCPLNSLACVLSRTSHVKSVGSTHTLKLLESLDLLRNLLTMTYNLLGELLYVDTLEVALLLLDKVGSTVESNTTIVADDTATTVSVRQTGNDVSMASSLDIIVVC